MVLDGVVKGIWESFERALNGRVLRVGRLKGCGFEGRSRKVS